MTLFAAGRYLHQAMREAGALTRRAASSCFVVVGWTDPEGARPWLGALLLAYYDPDGRLAYAGRVGAGIDYAE